MGQMVDVRRMTVTVRVSGKSIKLVGDCSPDEDFSSLRTTAVLRSSNCLNASSILSSSCSRLRMLICVVPFWVGRCKCNARKFVPSPRTDATRWKRFARKPPEAQEAVSAPLSFGSRKYVPVKHFPGCDQTRLEPKGTGRAQEERELTASGTGQLRARTSKSHASTSNPQ